MKTGLSKEYRKANKEFKSYRKDMNNNAELKESYVEERVIHVNEDTDVLEKYLFLDIQSNKSKVLKYLKDNNETQKYAQDTIDNYNGEIIVSDNKMIGRILVGDKRDKGFITDFIIDKEYRGNKLGSKLLDDAINKYGGYDLLVDKDNKLAIDMYRKRGFETAKTYKNQYYMVLKNKINESCIEESVRFIDLKNIILEDRSKKLSYEQIDEIKNLYIKSFKEDYQKFIKEASKEFNISESKLKSDLSIDVRSIVQPLIISYIDKPSKNDEYSTIFYGYYQIYGLLLESKSLFKKDEYLNDYGLNYSFSFLIENNKVIKIKNMSGFNYYMAELNESTINESKDVSTLTDGFKTKSGKTFKLVDVDTPEAFKYISEKWRESKNGKTLYVALSEQDDYEIAGFIGWNKSGNIAPLRVYEKFRGYGLSEILLKLAIKNGGHKLGVYSDNEVAIRLYKKFGFAEVDRKTYKDGDVVIIMELKNKINESCIKESFEYEIVDEMYTRDEYDIMYNKKLFDNGDINLCFITGHSGSGKSTYAHYLEKKYHPNIEVYELDDVIATYNFSDENLKEYGDMINSFFKKNPKYRIPNTYNSDNVEEWIKDNKFISIPEYSNQVSREFVKYAKNFVKYHSRKYIIEGIQLFCYFKPEEFKDYAFYIKGTSAFKSWIRSAIRDGKDGFKNKWMMLKDYNWYEQQLYKFRDYYAPKTKNYKEEEMDLDESAIIFNELMSAVGYAPVVGIEKSDAYIVNYMSNQVFNGEPSEYYRDKIAVTNSRDLHDVVGLDDKQRLRKLKLEEIHNPILYKSGKTNEEVSALMERCMNSVVFKDYVYETITGQRVYGDVESQAAATLDRVEILDREKFFKILKDYLLPTDEIDLEITNLENKIRDIKNNL